MRPAYRRRRGTQRPAGRPRVRPAAAAVRMGPVPDFPPRRVPMQILLANPRGFCAGVNMAVDALDLAVARFGSGPDPQPVYVYHEIVHNKAVVERFTRSGVTFVDSVEEVPRGGVLMYSAHGVSPAIRDAAKARGLFTIDATCPLVTKVHIEAIRYAQAGYHIVLIGHEGHDEVIGTMGEAPESITLVDSPEEVDALAFPPPGPTGPRRRSRCSRRRRCPSRRPAG